LAESVTILPSISRNADVDGSGTIIVNDEGSEAVYLTVDVTAGAPNLLVYVKGLDTTSGKSFTLLQSGFINGGTTLLRVGPQLTAGANIAKEYLPRHWFVDVTQSGGVSATYSIGASMI
jgi:hypothetical protein